MYLFLVNLPPLWKRLIHLAVDLALIPLALALAFMLRLSDPWPEARMVENAALWPVLFMMGLALTLLLGTHRIKLYAFDLSAVRTLAFYAALMGVFGATVNWVFWLGAPRTVPVIFATILLIGAVSYRMVARAFMKWLLDLTGRVTPVAIYGAGAAGVQLASALMQTQEIKLAAIVDDNTALHGVVVAGQRVRPPKVLRELADAGVIKRVLLALPSASRTRRHEILEGLKTLPCDVQAMPSYLELISGGGLLESLRPVASDDLLGRDNVELDLPEVARAYAGRTVLVTGAGGSIGSELCRQIITCHPRRIVLFEHSEIALYTIDRELQPLAAAAGVELITLLGSVCDRARVDAALADHQVEIVLHAAAYKHVPLVEKNEIEGVRNNIFGTQTVAQAALTAGVERFILVSTDKAVRPTNIMGATKRLAELVIQDLQTRATATKFAMVRFGNVLGSSGSVIPLFRDQIAKGGPVTLTHTDVTRYFMTIPEAARLVLLAGSYADGGDVFVLDMGEPVKIANLARRMIEMSGLVVRDAKRPDGDIEVITTGMRPGEKLFEELLIGSETLETPHEKILRAQEGSLSQIEMAGALSKLERAVETRDTDTIRAVMEHAVDGYTAAVNPLEKQAE